MKKKKIIFFSIEPGLAHITRSLSIAQELKKRGHEIIFPIHESKQEFIRSSGIKTIPLSILLPSGSLRYAEKLTNLERVTSCIKEEQNILSDYNPDIAVVDFRLSAVVSCASKNVPTVFLTGSDGLPYDGYLPNPGFPNLVYKMLYPLIKQIVRRVKRPFVETLLDAAKEINYRQSFNELFKRLQYICPEIVDYLPMDDSSVPIHYVGPIFWDGFKTFRPKWLSDIQPNGNTIYVSFGGTGFDGRKLINLSSKLALDGFRVIVSSSTIVDVKNFPENRNLFVSKFLPGEEISRRVDLILCHGGYGTLMQAVLAGKPVVSIPFNPDQLIHSLRFEELGLGCCMINLNILSLLQFKWERFEELSGSIPDDYIIKTIRRIMNKNDFYQKKIRKFRKQLPKVNGNINASNIIETIR